MLEHVWSTVSGSSLGIVAITLLFFTLKGVIWLAVPILIVRWRRRSSSGRRGICNKSLSATIPDICE